MRIGRFLKWFINNFHQTRHYLDQRKPFNSRRSYRSYITIFILNNMVYHVGLQIPGKEYLSSSNFKVIIRISIEHHGEECHKPNCENQIAFEKSDVIHPILFSVCGVVKLCKLLEDKCIISKSTLDSFAIVGYTILIKRKIG